MIKLQELDTAVSIRDQLADTSQEPVILINVFHVDPEKVDAVLAAWADDARYMKAQPGFISTQLYRGTEGSGTLINHAVWQNVAAFRAASKPELQAAFAHYPDGAESSPHLFRKVAVDGICVA